MRIRPNRLILAIHKDPKTDIRLGEVQRLSDYRFESSVGIGLEHTEGSKVVRCGCVLVVKGREVEALVVAEGFVRDDLDKGVGGEPWSKGDVLTRAVR